MDKNLRDAIKPEQGPVTGLVSIGFEGEFSDDSDGAGAVTNANSAGDNRHGDISLGHRESDGVTSARNNLATGTNTTTSRKRGRFDNTVDDHAISDNDSDANFVPEGGFGSDIAEDEDSDANFFPSVAISTTSSSAPANKRTKTVRFERGLRRKCNVRT